MATQSEETVDMWSGWFDFKAEGIRIQFRNGVPGMRCAKNCCGQPSMWFADNHHPFGHFPDLPDHLRAIYYSEARAA